VGAEWAGPSKNLPSAAEIFEVCRRGSADSVFTVENSRAGLRTLTDRCYRVFV